MSTPLPVANGSSRSPTSDVSSPARPVGWRAVLGVCLAALLAACAAPPFDAKAIATEWAAYMQRDYVLRPGDRLSVRVEGLSGGAGDERANVQEVVVSPTGTIDLRQLTGPLVVGGKSVGSMRTQVIEAYTQLGFTGPRVGVSLTEAAAQSVYVCGEVFRPGPVAYHPGLTMTMAIAAAGSFNITVKHSDIRVLRINQDGTQRTTRVNMEAVLLDQQPDFLLLPGDVIYAQTSGIAEAGNWVELWIRRLLPFEISSPGPTTGN
jgi:protein involved in polysaccharide export with SLBB domain